MAFFFVCLLLFCTYDYSYAVVTASSSSDEYDNDDRLLTRDKNDSKNGNDTLLRGLGVGPERLMRRDQSKDLKRLIQELEESDYSNYGSWGNFRSRPSPPISTENYPSPEGDIYRNSPDVTTVHEHEVFWNDPVDDGSNVVHSDGSYRNTNYDPGRHHHGGFGPRYPGGGLSGRPYNQSSSPPHDYNYDLYSLDEDDVTYQPHYRDQRQYRPSSSASWDYRDVVAGSTVSGNDITRWEDSQSDEDTRLLPYQPYQSHNDDPPYHTDYGNTYAHRPGPSPTHQMGANNYPPQSPSMIMSSREHRASRDNMNGGVAIATVPHSDTLSIGSQLDPKRELQFHSVLSLTSVLVFCTLSAYLSVTPRLPNMTKSSNTAAGERLFDLFSSLTSTVHDSTLMSIYNHSFKQIFLRLLVGTFVWPWMVMMTVFRRCDADINQVIHTFVHSFTFGYAITVVVQIIVATLIQLVVLHWLQPTILHLCPHIPNIFLPWQLRECQDTLLTSGGTNIPAVHLHHATKLVISLLTTCVVMPVLEEYMKLSLFRWNFPVISADNDYLSIPRTNSIHTPTPQPPSPRGQTRNDHIHTSSIQPPSIQPPTTNPIRTCIIGMLSASYGLKIADNVQRILSYNKLIPSQQHKTFFAIARGLFPIQELCGAMTAIKWAKFQQEEDLRWLMKQSSAAAASSSSSSSVAATAAKPEDKNTTSRKGKEELKENKGKGGEEIQKTDATTSPASTPRHHLLSTTSRTSKSSSSSSSTTSSSSSSSFDSAHVGGRYRHHISFIRLIGDILWPAISLHAMANFRGMKPLFSWSSVRPWQEMQLQAWNAIDTSTPMQMMIHGGVNLLWFLWLARLFAGVMKDYVAASQQHVFLQLQMKMQSEQQRFPLKGGWRSSMQSSLSSAPNDPSSPTSNNHHYQQQPPPPQQQRRQLYGRGPYPGQSIRGSSNNSPPR